MLRHETSEGVVESLAGLSSLPTPRTRERNQEARRGGAKLGSRFFTLADLPLVFNTGIDLDMRWSRR